MQVVGFAWTGAAKVSGLKHFGLVWVAEVVITKKDLITTPSM